MAADRTRLLDFLGKKELKDVKSFLHHVIDSFCGRSVLQYNTYSRLWSLEQYWQACMSCQRLVKQAVGQCWTKDQFFKQLGSLPDNMKQAIYDVIDVHSSDVREQLQKLSVSISQRELTDFDWQVKLMMSSDKFSHLHKPICSLDLDVRDSQTSSKVSVELDRDDLKRLIGSLEAANKVMVQCKS